MLYTVHNLITPSAITLETFLFNLTTFDELPKFREFSGCAWGVWGEGDQLGTINLLTRDVVKEGARLVK